MSTYHIVKCNGCHQKVELCDIAMQVTFYTEWPNDDNKEMIERDLHLCKKCGETKCIECKVVLEET